MLSGKNIFHRQKEVPSRDLDNVLDRLEVIEIDAENDRVTLNRKQDENFIELGTAIEEMSVLVGVLCIVTSFCMGYIIWELITKGGE